MRFVTLCMHTGAKSLCLHSLESSAAGARHRQLLTFARCVCRPATRCSEHALQRAFAKLVERGGLGDLMGTKGNFPWNIGLIGRMLIGPALLHLTFTLRKQSRHLWKT